MAPFGLRIFILVALGIWHANCDQGAFCNDRNDTVQEFMDEAFQSTTALVSFDTVQFTIIWENI